MAVFLLIISLSMFRSIESTCGPAGTTIGADLFGHSSTAAEGHTLIYQCKNSFKQVYGRERKCVRGKWTNRIPKCAIKESSRLIVESYKVNYFDIQESNGLDPNKTFEYLDYIMFNESRRFTFGLYYKPNARLSYVELDLQIQDNSLSSNIRVSLRINDYRDCVKSLQRYSKLFSVIEFQFICETKSDIDYEIEGKDLPKSLRFQFESQNKFKSRILRIDVFKFQNYCGSFPDIPLNAKTIVDSGQSVSIYSSNPNRYKIWGKDNDTSRCLFEGNWDKEFEPLYPIISCPINNIDFEANHYQNVSREYFEYYNDTFLATVDSKIQFQCNNSKNSPKFYYIYCQENGNWSDDLDVCSESDKTNDLLIKSDLFVILVTLLTTFVTTITLTLIFVSIIVWRKRVVKRRNRNKYNVKYVKDSELENYRNFIREEVSGVSAGHYETVNYQELDAIIDNEGKLNHLYMQIVD